MRILLPEPGETTVADQLEGYRPWEEATDDRPHIAVNFAETINGAISIDGRSGAIGSDTDTEMLVGLRRRFDAVMIGAGTLRAEGYGRIIGNPDVRARREEMGLPGDPLAILISGGLDLPWDAPIFTDGGGQILAFTASDKEAPETATRLDVVRHPDGVDIAEAMRHVRVERGVRSLLCEGGPTLHGALQADGLVDDLFLTTAPKVTAGGGAQILSGGPEGVIDMELAWLLEEKGELFARYRRPAR